MFRWSVDPIGAAKLYEEAATELRRSKSPDNLAHAREAFVKASDCHTSQRLYVVRDRTRLVPLPVVGSRRGSIVGGFVHGCRSFFDAARCLEQAALCAREGNDIALAIDLWKRAYFVHRQSGNHSGAVQLFERAAK
jgi:hypothetical protein